MTNVDADRKVRPVLSDPEFKLILSAAMAIPFQFLAIRNTSILCMIRITGKRREEIAALTRRDVFVEDPNLAMNFKLLKKRHRKKLSDGTIIPAGPPPQKVRYVSLKDPLVYPILDLSLIHI